MKVPRFVYMAAVVALATIALAGLTDRVSPIFPGVQIESGKPGWLLPGTYCSTGFLVYDSSTARYGYIIASHCTDPGDWPRRVFQPVYSFFGDNNYAGYTIDLGTNNAYGATKPDAALWIVENRYVSKDIPFDICGPQKIIVNDYAKDSDLDKHAGKALRTVVYYIGHQSGCVKSTNALILKRDPRYGGSVYPITNIQMPRPGDSGGIVLINITCGSLACSGKVMGIVIGGIPPGSPTYMLVQSAENAAQYYGVIIITNNVIKPLDWP